MNSWIAQLLRRIAARLDPPGEPGQSVSFYPPPDTQGNSSTLTFTAIEK